MIGLLICYSVIALFIAICLLKIEIRLIKTKNDSEFNQVLSEINTPKQWLSAKRRAFWRWHARPSKVIPILTGLAWPLVMMLIAFVLIKGKRTESI